MQNISFKRHRFPPPVIRLEEAGCEPGEIGAITGHSRQTIIQLLDQHYGARTEKMARNAWAKRLDNEPE